LQGTNFTVRDIATNTTYCPRWDRGWGYEIDHTHPAAQAWYDSLVELWSSWGVDLIKLDCVNAEDELAAHRMDIIRISAAMQEVRILLFQCLHLDFQQHTPTHTPPLYLPHLPPPPIHPPTSSFTAPTRSLTPTALCHSPSGCCAAILFSVQPMLVFSSAT
jgi:hypothetical protein